MALNARLCKLPFSSACSTVISPSPFLYSAFTLITFASYLFYNYALRRLPLGRISLMYPLTGPIGATSAWIVVDAEINFKIFLSLIIILIGTIIPYINKKS